MKHFFSKLILTVALIASLGAPSVAFGAFSEGLWQVFGTYTKVGTPGGLNVLITGSNKYLNFGSLSGTSGYGIRDNGGVIEVKSSGGSWDTIASGVVSSAWGGITGTLSAQTDLQSALDAKQPLDSDLTTIAGLTATTDNFMVGTASAWASRTPTQARSQLGLGTLATQSGTFSGTSSGTNTGDQTSVSGNAGTATALFANGANCSSGQSPLGVDASGAVESCFDVWTEAENTSAGYLTASSISDTIYGAGWNGDTTHAPSKNAVYDKIESVSAGSGLTIGSTAITSGTNTKVLYDNSGTLGEYTVSGSGNVAMTTSPIFTTPNIGVATGSVSGNAGTATALSADPADCVTSTHFAVGIVASGVATCEAIADADVPNNITIDLATLATTVTTNANLTGAITSTGNATILGSFTTSALNTALSDNDVATIAGTETLTGKTLTTPKIADMGYIADANGNEMLVLDTITSAVNEWRMTNSATLGNPKLSATGGDANIGLDFQAKGTGLYRLLATASGSTDLRLFEDTDNGTNNVSLIPASSLASDFVLTLPSATDTLVGKATTDTFTNKTLTSSTNVLGGVTLTLGSDADGDTYYRSSNVLTRLAKGTAGQVLTMNAGATAPSWATASGADYNTLVGVSPAGTVKTYFTFPMPFMLWAGAVINDTTTTFVNWTRTDATKVVVPPGGSGADFESTSAAILYIDGFKGIFYKGNTDMLSFDDTNKVILDWWAKLPTTSTGDINMGFTYGTAGNVAYNDATIDNYRMTFSMRGSTGIMYATSSKGSGGVTNTDISSGLTMAQWNNYRIEFDLGNDAKFYVNGVLKATIATANLYTGATGLGIGFGRSNTALFQVSSPTLSVEMNP